MKIDFSTGRWPHLTRPAHFCRSHLMSSLFYFSTCIVHKSVWYQQKISISRDTSWTCHSLVVFISLFFFRQMGQLTHAFGMPHHAVQSGCISFHLSVALIWWWATKITTVKTRKVHSHHLRWVTNDNYVVIFHLHPARRHRMSTQLLFLFSSSAFRSFLLISIPLCHLRCRSKYLSFFASWQPPPSADRSSPWDNHQHSSSGIDIWFMRWWYR